MDGVNSILPTRSAIIKLRNILANNTGAGTIDLVWGPELDFKESNTQVHNFLGPQKYAQIMAEIYGGFGIPASLTGSGAGGQGYTNNFVSMKTLVERLRYGRNVLTSFWNEEFKLVAKTMGFNKSASLLYDETLMSDDTVYKNFLLASVDRDIISEEEFRERCGFVDDVERAKLRREFGKRKSKNYPNKAGPYHNAMKDEDLKKIILQNGGVTPSELGIELLPKDPKQKTLLEQKQEFESFKSEQLKGRPLNSKDGKKRKRKVVKPKVTGSEFVNKLIWANTTSKTVSDILLPAILASANKKDIRSLTEEEKTNFEYLKYSVLTKLNPLEQVNEEKVYSLLEDKTPIKEEILTLSNLLTLKFVKNHLRQPSIDETRQIQCSAFILTMENDNGKDNADT